MSAITRASDMSRWTAATNGWRSIVGGVPSRAGSAGVMDGSGAWSMSVGTALSRARFRPAPPLLGPAVVWNAGAPAWSVGEVCPWVRLLQRGAGRLEAGGSRGGRGVGDDAVGPIAEWRRRRGWRWAVPDGGKEKRDEVEVDGVRRFLSICGDVGEVWPRWVRGEELEDARSGRRRERGRRVPADVMLDGEPIRGCCLRACRAAGEARRDGLDGLLGREVERVDPGRSSRRPRFGVRTAIAVVRHIAPPRSGE